MMVTKPFTPTYEDAILTKLHVDPKEAEELVLETLTTPPKSVDPMPDILSNKLYDAAITSKSLYS